MTLSTRHDPADLVDAAREAAMDRAKPGASARQAVHEIEGSREEPTEVSSPKARAEEIANDVASEARSELRSWDIDGHGIVEEVSSLAYDAALGTIRESPCIEVET